MESTAARVKEKKERFKKYQYTKPYKDRDRTKDFGKGLPLKKSGNRLKFPQKPQYYTLYTVQKLKNDHPFFNIFNRDIEKVRQAVKQAKQSLSKRDCSVPEKSNISDDNVNKSRSFCNRSESFQLRPSAFDSKSCSKLTPGLQKESNKSSLGIVTLTNKSQSQSLNPFCKGYSVTSGPKVYKVSSQTNSEMFHCPSVGVSTPVHSILSIKQVISQNYLNEIYSSSERPSV